MRTLRERSAVAQNSDLAQRLSLLGAVILAVAAGVVPAARASPGGTPTLAAIQPLLRLGSEGPLVADWQEIINEWLRTIEASPNPRPADLVLLHRLGGRLQVDGLFGQATLAATKQWQRESYLPVNGVVGLRTWLSWIGANVTCCGAGYPNFGPAIVKLRDPSAPVGWWQLALDRWLHVHRSRAIPITGRYDAATRAATRRFQQGFGLRPTGIAAEATWLQMSKVPHALEI